MSVLLVWLSSCYVIQLELKPPLCLVAMFEADANIPPSFPSQPPCRNPSNPVWFYITEVLASKILPFAPTSDQTKFSRDRNPG